MIKKYLLDIFFWILAAFTLLFNNSKDGVFFLDVGQGDAVLIQKNDVQILIDGGEDNSVLCQIGKYMPFGDMKIELVVLTHPHSDHLNGLFYIFERYEIEEVWYNDIDYKSEIYEYFLELDIPREEAKEGIIYYIDTWRMEVLSVHDEIYEEESWGEFHNPIIYDYKKRTSKKIIDFSFIGDKLSFENISNNNVIAFTGACEDTDGDGQITLLDFNSLYVYSIEDRVLRKVTKENYTVNSFEFVKGQKDILLNINYDKNKDNEIDSNTEPSFIMRYDYSRDKLIPLVDEDFQNDIIKSDKNITMIKRYN